MIQSCRGFTQNFTQLLDPEIKEFCKILTYYVCKRFPDVDKNQELNPKYKNDCKILTYYVCKRFPDVDKNQELNPKYKDDIKA